MIFTHKNPNTHACAINYQCYSIVNHFDVTFKSALDLLFIYFFNETLWTWYQIFKDNEKKEKNPPKKGSQQSPEYGPPLTGLSLTKRIWQKNSDEREDTMLEGSNMISRAHVLNPKYSTPTSLPLYFYFVYQVLQESDELGQLGPVSLDICNLWYVRYFLDLNACNRVCSKGYLFIFYCFYYIRWFSEAYLIINQNFSVSHHGISAIDTENFELEQANVIVESWIENSRLRWLNVILNHLKYGNIKSGN